MFIDDTTMLTICVPPPMFEAPPGGVRVVDDTGTLHWLYLLTIIPDSKSETYRTSLPNQNKESLCCDFGIWGLRRIPLIH